MSFDSFWLILRRVARRVKKSRDENAELLAPALL